VTPFTDDKLDWIENNSTIDWRTDLPEADHLYWRFDSTCTHYADGSTSAYIYINTYAITHRTPKGLYVDWFGTPKLIIHSHIKKWAYPTKQKAFNGWLRRFGSRKKYHATEGARIAALTQLLTAEGEL